MATDTDGIPILACCPPNFHDQHRGIPCLEMPNPNVNFRPEHQVWFTLTFIHRVMFCGNLPEWSFEMGEDGHGLMKYRPFRDSLASPMLRDYIWKLTGKRGGPNEFWHEGMWPD